MKRTLSTPRTVVAAQLADEVVLSSVDISLDAADKPVVRLEVKHRQGGQMIGNSQTKTLVLSPTQEARVLTLLQNFLDMA